MIERRKVGGCDRRREPRCASAGTISWRMTGSDRAFIGWLSDRSRSSLSFITARKHAPSLGEAIEVVGSDRRRRAFRTTRIAGYDDDFSLIACRNVTVAES